MLMIQSRLGPSQIHSGIDVCHVEGNCLSHCCLGNPLSSGTPAPQPQEEPRAGSVVALAGLALPSHKFFLRNHSKPTSCCELPLPEQ